jgi:hypothetical protein
MTITKEQRAWMAGVIETRGKIRFTNDANRKTNQLVLQVRISNTAIVARLCELTGTAIDEKDAKTIEYTDRRACSLHCPEPHVHVLTSEIPEHAVWAISGCGAAIVLDNLVSSFEATDKDEIRAVAANIFAGLPHGGRGRSAVDATIIRLKKLGWRIPPAALEHFIGLPTLRSSRGRFTRQPQPVNA